jgi:hypothetical protein
MDWKRILKSALKQNIVPRKEYKDMFFELTGREGSEFVDLRVNRWGYGRKIADPCVSQNGDHRLGVSVHLICKIVGIIDDKAPKRNWGFMSKKLEKKKK